MNAVRLIGEHVNTSKLPPLPARRFPIAARGVYALLLAVALLAAFAWSCTETLPISVRLSRSAYRADVGGNITILRHPPRGGALAVYEGSSGSYEVMPYGPDAAIPVSAALAQLGTTLRLAFPGPAWKDVRLQPARQNGLHDHPALQQPLLSPRSMTVPDARVRLLETMPPGPATLSAHLLRGDGLQGIVLNLTRSGNGVMLGVHLDQRFATWYRLRRWRPQLVAGAGPPQFRLLLLPALQRAVRTALEGAMLALVLAVGAVILAPISILLSGSEPTHRVPPRMAHGAAIILAAAATLTAAWIALTIYRDIPNVQDAVAYLFQARTLAAGHLWNAVPPSLSFFHQEFILAVHGHWFGKYPLGWPMVLAAGVRLGVPWLVNPLLLGGSLLLLYLAAKKVYGAGVSILATAIAAASPMLLALSGSYLSHTATLFYLSAFAYLMLRWGHGRTDDRHASLLLLAGLALGLAAITRPLDAAGFSLPFGLLLMRRPARAIWVALGAAVPVLFFALYNHALAGSFLADPYTLLHPWDRLGFGPNVGGPGPYYAGYTIARGFWNIAYELQLLQVHGFGWPFGLTLALPVLPFILGRWTRWDLLFAGSIVALMAAYLLYYDPGIWMGYPRYDTLAFPWLALLSARGLQELANLPARLPFPGRKGASRLLPGVVIALMAAYLATVYVPAQYARLQFWNGANRDALQAVEQAHLRHALIFQVQNPTSDWWPYGGVFNANALDLRGTVVFARDEGSRDRILMRQYPGWSAYRLNNKTLTRIEA